MNESHGARHEKHVRTSRCDVDVFLEKTHQPLPGYGVQPACGQVNDRVRDSAAPKLAVSTTSAMFLSLVGAHGPPPHDRS